MAIQALTIAPPKMKLVNTVTLVELEAQYNPTEFTEKVGANYARQAVLGNSHEILQFANSKNDVIDFTLYFSSANGGPAQQQEIERARAFLRSMTRPRGGLVGAIKSGGAPRCLFIWPNMLSMEAVITEVAFQYTRFNLLGRPCFFQAKVTLERALDGFVSSEDVYEGDDV